MVFPVCNLEASDLWAACKDAAQSSVYLKVQIWISEYAPVPNPILFFALKKKPLNWACLGIFCLWVSFFMFCMIFISLLLVVLH